MLRHFDARCGQVPAKLLCRLNHAARRRQCVRVCLLLCCVIVLLFVLCFVFCGNFLGSWMSAGMLFVVEFIRLFHSEFLDLDDLDDIGNVDGSEYVGSIAINLMGCDLLGLL